MRGGGRRSGLRRDVARYPDEALGELAHGLGCRGGEHERAENAHDLVVVGERPNDAEADDERGDLDGAAFAEELHGARENGGAHGTLAKDVAHERDGGRVPRVEAREIAVVERRERCAEQAARLRRDVLAHETRWTSLAKEAEKLHRLALEAGRLCGDLDLAQRAAERADAILASITEERQRVATALEAATTDTGADK